LPIIGEDSYDINDMAAASLEQISFAAFVPTDVPVGDYVGEITVSSTNAGSVIIRVTITNDTAAEDLSRNGAVDVNDIVNFASHWLETTQIGDTNGDRVINYGDIQSLCLDWLSTGSALPADFSRDHRVAWEDFAVVAKYWQQKCVYLLADFNHDGRVDFLDFGSLTDKWLWQADWHGD